MEGHNMSVSLQSAPGFGKTPPAHDSAGGLGKVLAGLIALAIVAGGAYFAVGSMKTERAADSDLVLYEVKRQDLPISVVERGSLESSKNEDLLCEVEARTPGASATTIIWIIPEGSQVKKGDLVVELEAASLKDQVTQQQIKVEQSKAALTKADTDLEITRSQNDSDIQTAQIAVDLAEIDLKKYLDGDYRQEKRNIDGEILIAEEEHKRAIERLDYSEKLTKKGYVSASEVEADRLAVTKAKNSLDVANEKRRVLDEFTKPRTEKDLTSKLDEARRKLDRVSNEAKAKEAQARVAMQAQKLTTETEENTLRRLQRQIDKCKLYAPTDGMVVYANDPGSAMRGQSQVQIEEGASVRERQKIIRLPDLDSMVVNVKVHEARVSHARIGQAARIRVESMPDKVFNGTVKSVATTADAQSWFSTGVQVYTVMVAMENVMEGLKPGMTAEVEILAGTLSDAVCIPVQALVEREGQTYCFVKTPEKPTPEVRRVEIDGSNEKTVAIKKGLSEGETVVENLTAIIDEEELAEIAKADAEKRKAELPPAPKVAQSPPPPKAEANGPAGANGGSDAAAGKTAGGPSLLDRYDANKDGKITLADEVPEQQRSMLTRQDTNSDGVIDAAELAALRSRGRQGGGAGAAGFRMPQSGREMISMSDKNSDGKLTKDELDERGQMFFDRMDTNTDGVVDEAEAETSVQRMKQMMQQMQQQGGGGLGGPPGGAPGGAQ
jgi:RND family efflux transporter MFP subunit